jgi:hypothetical protein
MRSLAGDVILSVVADFIHRQFRILHTVVPYLTPIAAVVAAWVTKHSLSTVENLLKVKTFFHTATLHFIASHYNSSSDILGSSALTNKFANRDKPNPKDPNPKSSIDFGVCEGYCLSIFFKGTCKRLKSKRSCTAQSKAGNIVKLKHRSEYDALAPSVKQKMQTHFQDVIFKGLNTKQVDFYST